MPHVDRSAMVAYMVATLPVPPIVLAYGQRELESMITRGLPAGGRRWTHLISIGEPRPLFRHPEEEERMPQVFRGDFKAVLRLGFTDMLSTEPRLPGQRPPSARDAIRDRWQ